MDDATPPRSPRTVRLALAGALALGSALVAFGVGGLAGVDRQLEAATPQQGPTHVVGEKDRDRGDCPADEPQAKQSRKL